SGDRAGGLHADPAREPARPADPALGERQPDAHDARAGRRLPAHQPLPTDAAPGQRHLRHPLRLRPVLHRRAVRLPLGFVGAVLRYIPYLGPWVAGVLPVVLSVALLPGWTQPVLVLVLILALELVISNFVEPLLYGQSIGVSEVALLVAAAFWTWLWGP